MNRLQSYKAYLMYRKAVLMADKKHRETGNRYFVLPNLDEKVFLIVTDRKNFRILRRKGYIDHNMKIDDVFKACFYYTPQKDGLGKNLTEDELKVKQLHYQVWYGKRVAQIAAARKRRRRERLGKLFGKR